MLLLKIILLGIIAQGSLGRDPLQGVFVEPDETDADGGAVGVKGAIGSMAGSKCNSTKVEGKDSSVKFSLKLKQPFLDMTIQNDYNILILKENENRLLFLLHGNELYQIFISGEAKKMDFLGFLNENLKENPILGAKIIKWQNYLLLAVASAEHIDIYQISLTNLNDPLALDGNLKQFDLIQQLRMPGNFQKLYLLYPEEGKVMLIVAVQFTNIYGKLRSFEWHGSYFDPIEELMVPQMSYIHLIGSSATFLVTGRIIKSQDKTILSIYEIQKPTLNLRNLQTLTVGSRKVHAFTFHDRNYLLACSPKTKKKCHLFKMSDKQFYLFKQRPEKDYALDLLEAGENYIVGVRSQEVKVFSSQKLDCHLSFTSNKSDTISAFISYQNNKTENFVLIHYKTALHSLIRVIEVELDADSIARNEQNNLIDFDDVSYHQHLFENTVGQLRSLLLKRRSAMDTFKRINSTFGQQIKYYQSNKPIKVQSGKIGTVKLFGNNLASPLEILQRVDMIRKTRQRKRPSRAINMMNMKKKIVSSLKVKKLRVGNLLYGKPIIDGFLLDRSSRGVPILSIRKAISTKRVITDRLLTRSNYRNIRETPSRNSTLLKLSDLNVTYINGISWPKFYETLFLRNRDKVIKGSLIFQDEVEINNLNASLLNGLIVDNLFNLVKPQSIESNILFNGFFVPEMQADRINGLNFSEDIVFRGQNTIIETPVRMHEVSIAGDLIIEEPSPHQKRQIHQDDLQQHYTQKVIIEGSLTVKDLKRDFGDKTLVIVGDKNFSETELRENYLLNNTDQIFREPVRFGNAKVTANNLNTLYLNDHPLEQHLFNEPEIHLESPLYLLFMNVTIAGNVICKDYNSKLKALNQSAVFEGEVANITGFKVFESPLKIDSLLTLSLNTIPVTDLVLKSQLNEEIHFKGIKTFEEIIVQNNLTVNGNLQADMLNKFPLDDLLNYDYHFDRLFVDHELNVLNVVFHKINGLSFDDVWLKLNFRNNQLALDKDLIVQGNAEFVRNVNIETINDVNWSSYEKSLVRVNENAIIEGEKTFLSDLTLTRYLNTPSINNEDLTTLFSNVFRKSIPQIIKEPYTFDNIKVSNIDVSIINEMPTSAFINLRQENVVINSDLQMPELQVKENLKGSFDETLPFEDLDRKIESLLNKKWKNIVVFDKASWPTHNLSLFENAQQNLFNYLFKNAVRKNGNQIISGNVQFHRPLITKMFTKTAFPNNIDLDFLAKDSLLKDSSSPQVIEANKNFLKSLHVQTAFMKNSLEIDYINDIDILRLNTSLYRLSSGEPIIGPLRFLKPLSIHNCSVQGLINEIHTNQIYHSFQQEVPPVKVKHLTIDDLEIGDINDMSLNYLLENRITKKGQPLEVFGQLTFENLKILQQAHLQTFNGIPLDNLVYKNGDHLQAITGKKEILGDLVLQGPAHALKLNGFNLMDLYQQSLSKDNDYKLNELTVDKVSFKNGLILKDEQILSSSNGKRSSKIPETSESFKFLTNELSSLEDNLEMKKSFLYLDYDFNKNLSWQKSNNETFIKSWTFDLNDNLPILSPCKRNLLQIQESTKKDHFFLQKLSTDKITNLKTSLKIKTQNFCKKSSQRIKSRTILNFGNARKTLGLKKFVRQVKILQLEEDKHLLLFHTISTNGTFNEIRTIRIEDNLNTIQSQQIINLGFATTWKLISLNLNQTFLIASYKHNDFLGVKIFAFDPSTFQFEEIQKIFGDYDMIDFINFNIFEKYQLILSCHQCKDIKIFESSSQPNQLHFKPFQSLKLISNIDSINPFVLSNSLHLTPNNHFLLVLSKRQTSNDCYLTLFEYSYEWSQHTFGHLSNVSLILPLVQTNPTRSSSNHIEENVLLLLCGHESKCSFVKAIVA